MWKTVKLGEVCEFLRGLTYSKSDEVTSTGGTAVLRATNIDLDKHKIVLDEIRYINSKVLVKQEKFAKSGDLLICTASGSKSHLGKVALVETDLGMAFGGFMASLRCYEQCIPKFLFFVLTSRFFKSHLASLSNGSNINNLKFSQIEQFQFPLPPLAEQQRIVEKLDRAFAEIDKAIEVANVQLNRSSLLAELVLEQIFRNEAASWRTEKLGNVIKVERGSSPRPIKDYLVADGGVNWIKIGDTELNGKYVSRAKEKISIDGAAKSRKVEKGDLILTNSMSFGRPYIMEIDGCIHDGWFVLRLGANLNIEYVYYLLGSPYVQKQFQSLAAGSVVKNISSELTKRAILPIPPISRQIEVANQISTIEAEVTVLQDILARKLDNLIFLKSSILKQALQAPQQ